MNWKPRVLELDASHCQTVYGNIFVLYTLAEASSENIDKLVENFDAFAKEATGPVGCVLITSIDTRPPEGEDRKKVTGIWGKHSAKLQGLAIVLQAKGFKGAVIRSVAAGIFVMPNPGFPTKFFGKPYECEKWMATKTQIPESKVHDAIEFALKQFPDDMPE